MLVQSLVLLANFLKLLSFICIFKTLKIYCFRNVEISPYYHSMVFSHDSYIGACSRLTIFFFSR